MKLLNLDSPAKVNLYLKIIRRLPNGYHELFTLFQRISLRDTLRLRKRSSGFFLRCHNPKLSTGEDNLITRAYRLLQKKFPNVGGVSVNLTKRIPLGSGLGGGSSNAASFLLGMKRLYSLRISTKALAQLGALLGADVPFFIYDTPQAVGTHYGEKIRPLPSQGKKHHFVLVISQKGLSTPAVYKAFKRDRKGASLTRLSRVATMLSDYLGRRQYSQVSKLLDNDLEIPAFQLRPKIQEIIDSFHAIGVSAVRMSGSGPTVFAITESRPRALQAVRLIRSKLSPGQKAVICSSY